LSLEAKMDAKAELSRIYKAITSLMSANVQKLKESLMTRGQIVEEMKFYASELKLDLSVIPVIHVAGTKGKGSTCAFIESILRHHGFRTGLFTSPHLINICERVRIDGRPCDLKIFSKHFWSIWNRLKKLSNKSPGQRKAEMPRFFQFMTLLAFDVFTLSDKPVDVIVLETGVGGRLDATNVLELPVATGITKIGYDHMNVLGSTLDKIAGEKAGIFKASVPAFTIANQDPLAMKALESYAKKKNVKDGHLHICEPLGPDIELGLKGKFQRENVSLALALAHCFLSRVCYKANPPADSKNSTATKNVSLAAKLTKQYPLFSPSALKDSLVLTSWPGRCQKLAIPGAEGIANLCIDGAHTLDSCKNVAEWFASEVNSLHSSEEHKDTSFGIVFNCSQDRDPAGLLGKIAEILRKHKVPISWVISCPFNWSKKKSTPIKTLEMILEEHSLPDPSNQAIEVTSGYLRSGSKLNEVKDSKKSCDDIPWQIKILRIWASISQAQKEQVVWKKFDNKEKSDSKLGLHEVGKHKCILHFASSIAEVIKVLAQISKREDKAQMTLVTGSLYLVGDTLGACGFKI